MEAQQDLQRKIDLYKSLFEQDQVIPSEATTVMGDIIRLANQDQSLSLQMLVELGQAKAETSLDDQTPFVRVVAMGVIPFIVEHEILAENIDDPTKLWRVLSMAEVMGADAVLGVLEQNLNEQTTN